MIRFDLKRNTRKSRFALSSKRIIFNEKHVVNAISMLKYRLSVQIYLNMSKIKEKSWLIWECSNLLNCCTWKRNLVAMSASSWYEIYLNANVCWKWLKYDLPLSYSCHISNITFAQAVSVKSKDMKTFPGNSIISSEYMNRDTWMNFREEQQLNRWAGMFCTFINLIGVFNPVQ